MSDSFRPTRLLCPWGFSNQEYWSGSPFPSPGDLPNPGIEAMSPSLAGGFFTTEPPGSPHPILDPQTSDVPHPRICALARCVPAHLEAPHRYPHGCLPPPPQVRFKCLPLSGAPSHLSELSPRLPHPQPLRSTPHHLTPLHFTYHVLPTPHPQLEY